MMFLFGLFLSAPLAVFALIPTLANALDRFANWLKGAVFVLLGIWSIYFGLYVDPANWTGQ